MQCRLCHFSTHKEIKVARAFLIFCVPSWAGDHSAEDQHQQQKQAEPEDQQEAPVTSSDSQPTVGTPSADYVTPYAPHDMAHAMVPDFVPFHFSLADK